MTEYKVVEIMVVTDENIESVLNEWTPKGWTLDGIRFAMRESQKRPSMAFVIFTRTLPDPEVKAPPQVSHTGA